MLSLARHTVYRGSYITSSCPRSRQDVFLFSQIIQLQSFLRPQRHPFVIIEYSFRTASLFNLFLSRSLYLHGLFNLQGNSTHDFTTITMKAQVFAIMSLLTLASARPFSPGRPLRTREVPQEHSHNKYLASVRTSLAQNNPDNIQDPVFGLLGNAAAAAGAGSIADTECLQQVSFP